MHLTNFIDLGSNGEHSVLLLLEEKGSFHTTDIRVVLSNRYHVEHEYVPFML